MLRFSANLSMLFTEVPLIERFALAKHAGFTAVEIQFPYELDVLAVQDQLEQHQLQLVLINLPAGDLMQGGDGITGVPDREHQFQQALFEGLQYARVLQVPTLNILAGRQPIRSDVLPCLETLTRNLRYASREIAACGITPVIEAINGIDMPRFLLQTIVQTQDMLRAVGCPALKIQYDCYHMAMMGEPVLAALQQNLAQMGHIQFADYPNRQQPSTGTLDFQAIFTVIKQSDYLGWTGAEYRPLGSTPDSLAWLQEFK